MELMRRRNVLSTMRLKWKCGYQLRTPCRFQTIRLKFFTLTLLLIFPLLCCLYDITKPGWDKSPVSASLIFERFESIKCQCSMYESQTFSNKKFQVLSVPLFCNWLPSLRCVCLGFAWSAQNIRCVKDSPDGANEMKECTWYLEMVLDWCFTWGASLKDSTPGDST